MADEQKVTPEGNATPSSAGVEKENSVDGLLENIQKLRKEKENYKLKALELENQLKIKLDSELVQKEEWKTLAEQRQKELGELKSKFEEKEKIINNATKMSSLKQELGKMGMDMKYLDLASKLVDLNTLTIDQETNVVLGVDSAVKMLKEKAAPLFVNQQPNVSHAAPQGNFQALTLEDFKALPETEKLKREKELLQNLGFKLKP